MRGPLVFLLLVTLAGCASLRETFTPQPGTKIRQIYFAGNQHVADRSLLAGLYAKPSSALPWRRDTLHDESRLDADARRVLENLHIAGYWNARVNGPRVETAGVDVDEVNLHFSIQEGPVTRVASVLIRGAPPGSGIDERRLGLSPGDVLELNRYEAGKQRIRLHLGTLGYAYAQVNGDVAIDKKGRLTADLTIDVVPGPQVRFGKTTVAGTDVVPDDDVLACIAWEEGELYDPELVALTERRLYALERFRSVHFDIADIELRPAVAHMVVRVEEAGAFEGRVGGGFAWDDAHFEARARAGAAVRGFPLPMTTLRFDGLLARTYLQTGERGWEYSLTAAVEHEDLVLPRLHLGLQGDRSKQVAEAYTLEGWRARAALTRPFWLDRLAVGVGWQWRDQDVESVDPAIGDADRAVLGLESPYRDAAFDQSLVLDLRNDKVAPRKGVYAELRVQEGGAAAGGHFGYFKLTPEVRGLYPVLGWLVAAARMRLGLGFAGDDELPITERYFAGGPSSQRGFPQQHLAPFATDADGRSVPIGGQALFEANVEGRLDVVTLAGNWLQLVVFLDGADATRKRADLVQSPFDLHWALGAGLRYQTPVGPVRFDYGFRLNRKDAGEPEAGSLGAFFFGLGEAF